MARWTSSPSLPVAVTAIAMILWSTGPGAEAVTDAMLKIACEDMTPRHPGYKAENLHRVPCPYRLLVETLPARPGDLVRVKLTSVNGTTPFKGFMVQARDADDRIIGTFLPDCKRDAQKAPKHMISCASGNEPYNAAVQSNNKYKIDADFIWVAPIEIKTPMRFKYTVVHDFEHFWTNEVTDIVPVQEISPEEYAVKRSINVEYYIYKLYIKNCYS